MADLPAKIPAEDPMKKRRAQAGTGDEHQLVFARKGLTDERLIALKEFLKHAKADEIAAIRGLYSDAPEILLLIGL